MVQSNFDRRFWQRFAKLINVPQTPLNKIGPDGEIFKEFYSFLKIPKVGLSLKKGILVTGSKID